MKREHRQTDRGRDGSEPPELGPAPSPEQVLDLAIEYTFPASDPIAIENAYQSARKREEKR